MLALRPREIAEAAPTAVICRRGTGPRRDPDAGLSGAHCAWV